MEGADEQSNAIHFFNVFNPTVEGRQIDFFSQNAPTRLTNYVDDEP